MKYLLLITIVTWSVVAQAQHWYPTAGPEEKVADDVCVGDDGTLYALTPLGFNRSTNGGEHWTRPFFFGSQTDKNTMMIAPNGNILFGCDSGIFLTSDKGETFIQVFDAPNKPNRVLHFATTGTGRIFAALKKSFVYSDDNGINWLTASSVGINNHSPIPTAIAASHDTVIGMFSILYRSWSNGDAWAGQNVQIPARRMVIYRDGSWIIISGGSIYRSTGHSLDWSHWGVGTTFDVMDDASIFVGSAVSLKRYTDLKNWYDISSGLQIDSIAFARPNRVVHDKTSGNYYVATIGLGVCKSSPTISVAPESISYTSVTVYPNPSFGNTDVQFALEKPEEVKVEVYDVLGRLRMKEQGAYGKGMNTVTLRTEGLASGDYIIYLHYGSERIAKRVVIQK